MNVTYHGAHDAVTVLALGLTVKHGESIDVPDDLGPASIDPSLVRHVLGNFISNAVDAMAGGGSLTVRARRAGDQQRGGGARCARSGSDENAAGDPAEGAADTDARELS